MKHTVLPAAAGALLLPLSLVVPATASPATHTSSSFSVATDASAAASGKKYERKIRVHTNKARTKHDRKPLHGNTCVDRFANRWAKKMARRQQLTHQALRPIMRRCDLSMAGENIAYGYPGGKAVVRGWMNSPGHRANILQRRYRLLGVGVKRDEHGRAWASQVFGRR